MSEPREFLVRFEVTNESSGLVVCETWRVPAEGVRESASWPEEQRHRCFDNAVKLAAHLGFLASELDWQLIG